MPAPELPPWLTPDTQLGQPILDWGTLKLLIDAAWNAGEMDARRSVPSGIASALAERERAVGIAMLLHDRASGDSTYGKAQRRVLKQLIDALRS
jgi:hypothetical protein